MINYVYITQNLGQPIKKLYKEIYSKTLQRNQNGILRNVQVAYKKAGMRKQRNKKSEENTNK